MNEKKFLSRIHALLIDLINGTCSVVSKMLLMLIWICNLLWLPEAGCRYGTPLVYFPLSEVPRGSFPVITTLPYKPALREAIATAIRDDLSIVKSDPQKPRNEKQS